MPDLSVTLCFAEEEHAPALKTCLEQLLQNLSLDPEEDAINAENTPS